MVAPGLTWLVVIACYAPWAPTLLIQLRHAGYDGSSMPLLTSVFFFAVSATTISGIFSLPLLLVLLAMIERAMREQRSQSCGSVAFTWQPLLLVAVPIFTFALCWALSFKTFLFVIRCQLMTAPCFILAASYGIASLRHFKWHAAVAVSVLFAFNDWNELGSIKSNAREVAAEVASRARASDLVVVTPPWLVSSFNYYYAQPNEQVCYPFEGRVGAIWYDDLRRRLADPRPIAGARARLAQARQAGSRVWLVTDRRGRSMRFPLGDQLPSRPDLDSFDEVGDARADQLLEQLELIYGKSVLEFAPLNDRSSSEPLRVLLFDPVGPLVP
jgi:hypothetical protein